MELRKDYVLDRWVILSPERKKRPREFIAQTTEKQAKDCVFCVGNEEKTPKQKGKIGDPWQIRWFDNLFPFAEMLGQTDIQTHNEFFTFGQPYGVHEIIVDSRSHDKQMWDLSANELKVVLDAYCNRIDELITEPHAQWVAVFKNHGKEAGASLVHSHSQVVSCNTVPQIIRAKIDATTNHLGCPYCRIVDIERQGERVVLETERFVSFTPYASRFAYELAIFPKRHLKSFVTISPPERLELAQHLWSALQTLKRLQLPFNLYLQYPPEGKDLHLHVEIVPHGSTWAGFEYATGTVVNSVSPESAAKEYRDAHSP